MAAKTIKTTNFKIQTSDNIQNSNFKQRPFDLEERMAKFGEDIIYFCKTLTVDHISRPIVTQLVRSATSVGANYAEVNNGSSRRDFRNKAHISKKEIQETKHWLRMLKPCFLDKEGSLKIFQQEAHELTLILQTIINKLDLKVGV